MARLIKQARMDELKHVDSLGVLRFLGWDGSVGLAMEL